MKRPTLKDKSRTNIEERGVIKSDKRVLIEKTRGNRGTRIHSVN